jgi:hypothetical protein
LSTNSGSLKLLETSNFWKPRTSGSLKLLETSNFWKPQTSGNLKLLESSNFWKPQTSGNLGVYLDPWSDSFTFYLSKMWYAVTHLVEALRYKLEDRGFDSQMESLEFFSDLILPVGLWPWGRLSL